MDETEAGTLLSCSALTRGLAHMGTQMLLVGGRVGLGGLINLYGPSTGLTQDTR